MMWFDMTYNHPPIPCTLFHATSSICFVGSFAFGISYRHGHTTYLDHIYTLITETLSGVFTPLIFTNGLDYASLILLFILCTLSTITKLPRHVPWGP